MAVRPTSLSASPAPFVAEATAAANALLVSAQLATALDNKIKEVRRKREKLTASAVVIVMQASTLKAAEKLRDEVRGIIASLAKIRINTARLTDEIDKDWGRLTGPRYEEYDKYRQRLRSFAYDLDALHENLIVVARCRNKLAKERALKANESSKKSSRDQLFDTPTKMNEVLRHLESDATDLVREAATL